MYRFEVFGDYYAFAYPGQDRIIIWNPMAGAGVDKANVITCERLAGAGSSACGRRVLSLAGYPSDSFAERRVRLVYSTRKSNSVLAVSMAEVDP